MRNLKTAIIVLLCTVMLFVSGCSKEANTLAVGSEVVKLRIGAAPSADSAPIFLAEKKGYFEELGIKVEVEVFTVEDNRLISLKTGELDGAMIGMTTFVEKIHNTIDAKVTTGTYANYSSEGADINENGLVPGVIVFTARALSDKEKEIELFHRAYDKAAEEIAKDESIAREVLAERLMLEEENKESIILPKYSSSKLPDERYMNKIIQWVESNRNIDLNMNYKDIIEGKFAHN